MYRTMHPIAGEGVFGLAWKSLLLFAKYINPSVKITGETAVFYLNYRCLEETTRIISIVIA